MSDLSSNHKRNHEKLLGMKTGDVMNFTDRTFSDFLNIHIKCNINDTYKKNIVRQKLTD